MTAAPDFGFESVGEAAVFWQRLAAAAYADADFARGAGALQAASAYQRDAAKFAQGARDRLRELLTPGVDL